MKVGFFLFEDVANKKDVASSRIRGTWVIEAWNRLYGPECEKFVYGTKYDAVVFQKAYLSDYAALYDGVKILDICDPDFYALDINFNEMASQVDYITCSSPELTEMVKSMTETSVMYIPDRHKSSFFHGRKEHRGTAREVVWYGYSHNSKALKDIVEVLVRNDLALSIISDQEIKVGEDTGLKERWTKWNLNTVNQNIKKSDFVIMPGISSPMHRFKSNNRETNAWWLGMPVAHTLYDLVLFRDPEVRNVVAQANYAKAQEHYNVQESAAQMRKLVSGIIKQKELLWAV